jgi:GGDEF domain-containing protein
MKRLRIWTTVLIIWLIFLFNIERINSPINIRDYTYVFVAITAVITLLLPRLRWLSYWVLILVSISTFLLFKVFWGKHLLWGIALPLTVTQISAIVLTGLISRQINSGLREFEDVISKITFGQIGHLPRPFSEMQGSIYSELKRARRYQRPLSVITLKVDEQSIRVALPKMIKVVQQAMMKEYVFANVSRILDDNIDDFGTITLRDNHFIVVLPEKTIHETSLMAQSLEKTIREKMDIEFQTGMASFPNDAITFEALIEQALKNVDQKFLSQHVGIQPVPEKPKQEIVPQEG